MHHYPESLTILCKDTAVWHCYSKSEEIKVDKVCTPVGGTSAFYHIVAILITVCTIAAAVSSGFNSFSCKDHACIFMIWQIDQISIVLSHCQELVLYGS